MKWPLQTPCECGRHPTLRLYADHGSSDLDGVLLSWLAYECRCGVAAGKALDPGEAGMLWEELVTNPCERSIRPHNDDIRTDQGSH